MGHSTMARVRTSKALGRAFGFLVSWDLDARDRSAAMKVYHFVFGREEHVNGVTYRYSGFVDEPGVRYLGQSVLLVPQDRVSQLKAFLDRLGVSNEAIRAVIG